MCWRNNVSKEGYRKYLHNSNILFESCLEMRLLGGGMIWKGLYLQRDPLTMNLTLSNCFLEDSCSLGIVFLVYFSSRASASQANYLCLMVTYVRDHRFWLTDLIFQKCWSVIIPTIPPKLSSRLIVLLMIMILKYLNYMGKDR